MEVSEAARRLKTLREQARLPMRVVAETLGWTLTRYQHYEDRYRRTFLPVELARRLADLFGAHGIDPREILLLAGIEAGAAPRMSLKTLPFGVAPGLRDLPVMGTAKGGSGGFYFNDGEPKEHVDRPASLVGVANAFALYVDGDSMEPRYFAGETVYVNPNRPITRNCFVAVEMQDGQGFIKRFIRRSDEHVVLHQFNPPKDIRLSAREVKQLYRITGTGESTS